MCETTTKNYKVLISLYCNTKRNIFAKLETTTKNYKSYKDYLQLEKELAEAVGNNNKELQDNRSNDRL